MKTDEITIRATGADGAINAFLVSLAFAEKAAADQCRVIAKELSQQGHSHLAEQYEKFTQEEIGHFEMVKASCKNLNVPISKCAVDAYQGAFFSPECTTVERMIAVHLVFEPSALAFLGFIANNIHGLVSDKIWADEIESSFRTILREEVTHVYSGRDFIKPLWDELSIIQKQSILKTVRKYRAFLKAGLPSFFKGQGVEPAFISEMIARFDFYFNKHAKDILYAEQKIAS